MLRKNDGFTLAELMLVLIMTGILASLSIGVIKYTMTNYKDVYYAAYRNLQKGTGEVISNSMTKKLPATTSPATTFCQQLADVYNTVASGTADCTYTYNMSPARTFSGGVLPTVTQPSFSLSNGQRYYVGSTFVPVGDENYFNQPATVVVIDLNGKGGPNVFDSRTNTKNAEIVAFDVLQDGTVLPMSPMADKQDGLLANVVTCSRDTGCDPDLTKNILYRNIPLRQALCVTKNFPPNTGSGSLTVEYNMDNRYSFKTTYPVNSACDTSTAGTTFCKVHIINPILGGMGATL